MSAFIAAACRSPVAPRDGALAALLPHQLATPVIKALLHQARMTEHDVDEVIVSAAISSGGNPARSVSLAAGLPERIAGLSIDRQCAGGMDALLLARQMILSGAAEAVIAGGVESYSRQPMRAHTFADGRAPEPYTQAPFTPWPDRDPEVSQAAAELAEAQNISRATQDEWAVASHARAMDHPPSTSEVIPIAGLTQDAFTRRLTPALCTRAKPITGSITAANAAVAADGAAFCLVVSERIANRLDLPMTQILGGATLGSEPTCPGLAPLVAIKETFAQTQLSPDDLSVSEVMEAYAVQAIACVRGAGLNPDAVNIGGGALARGHPIGASGAINVVRLHHEILAQDTTTDTTGLATIAAAGGIGSALILRA